MPIELALAVIFLSLLLLACFARPKRRSRSKGGPSPPKDRPPARGIRPLALIGRAMTAKRRRASYAVPQWGGHWTWGWPLIPARFTRFNARPYLCGSSRQSAVLVW